MSPQADRSPAFQFYARDFLSDVRVMAMSLEEVGAYWKLVSICWLEEGLPSDLTVLARLLHVTPSKLRKLWPAIEPCFRLDDGLYQHNRLDREREKQDEYRRKQSEKGRKSAEARSNHGSTAVQPEGNRTPTERQPEGNSSSSSSSSSASSTAVKSVESAPASVLPMRRRSMGAMGSSPAQHTGHGRCNDRGVCLPQILYTEILGRFGNDVTRFDAFYNGVLDTMPDDYVPTGSVFRFWHDMLERAHPEMSAPKPSPREAAMNAEW